MKTKIKIVIIALLFLCIGILGTRYYYDNNVNFYKNGFDDIFMSNFMLLCSNLNNNILKMDESQIERNNIQNVEYSYAMSAVFSYTTYAKNDDFSYIVLALNNMTGSHAIYEIVNDPEIIKQLVYLSYHMDSEESASILRKNLSKSLKEIETYN